jgi:integrase
LQAAARKFSRWAHRDATMILLGYRHGLRASELCDLQWSQVELATGRLHVRRAKNGTPSVHPLRGEELRALRRLQRECGPSPYVFQSERGGPMTPKSFHALFGRIGVWAKMPFPSAIATSTLVPGGLLFTTEGDRPWTSKLYRGSYRGSTSLRARRSFSSRSRS